MLCLKYMSPKILIFDLDSTLTESKQPMTREIGEVLKKLLEKMPVAVMSGADFPQFEKQLLSYLPADSNLENLFLFPTSAAECLEFKDEKWKPAYDFLFTKKEKGKIIRTFDAVLEKIKIIEGESSFGERIEDRGEQITFSGLGQTAPLDLKKKWDPDHAKRKLLKQELEKIIPEFEITIGGLTSVDINRKGISKEDGIIWLSKRFNIDPSDMLYVGDALFEGGNDAKVKTTSVQVKQVSGPKETLAVTQEILGKVPTASK